MKGFPVFLPVRLLLCGLALFLCLPAFAQEDVSINRYTLYTGFDYMISPARNLTQRGFDTDFGFTAKPWLGLGADFSASGDSFRAVLPGSLKPRRAHCLEQLELIGITAVHDHDAQPGGREPVRGMPSLSDVHDCTLDQDDKETQYHLIRREICWVTALLCRTRVFYQSGVSRPAPGSGGRCPAD